jgi:hypothetical protein
MWFKTLLVGLVFLSLSAHTGVPNILIMASGQDVNKKIGERLKPIGEKFGATTILVELENLKLPLYTPGLENNLELTLGHLWHFIPWMPLCKAFPTT